MQSKFHAVAASLKRGVLRHQAVMTLVEKQAPQLLPALNKMLSPSDKNVAGAAASPPAAVFGEALVSFSHSLSRCAHVPNQLRVATLNLWNTQGGNWVQRKAAIVQQIRESLFDVIALQEIRTAVNGTSNQLEELQEELSEYVRSTSPHRVHCCHVLRSLCSLHIRCVFSVWATHPLSFP